MYGIFLTENELADYGFIDIGKNVRIHERANIYGAERIRLGSNIKIDQFVNITATANLTIDDYVHIPSFSHLSISCDSYIGPFTSIGAGSKLITESGDMDGNSFNLPFLNIPVEMRVPHMRGPIILEGYNLVAMNSCVLPNCRLKMGAAVGMNSIVMSDLEEWGFYVGTPARRVRDRSKAIYDLGMLLKDKNEI